MRRGLKPPTELMRSRYNCHRHLCLFVRCDRTQLQTHPPELTDTTPSADRPHLGG